MRKAIAGGFLALLLAVQVIAVTPQVAQAEVPTAVIADVPALANLAKEEVRAAIKKSVVTAVFTGLVNLATFAANRLAYDAAVMLASGGAADSPLVEFRTADDYFADYKAAVAGEAVAILSEEVAEAGGLLSNFNFCSPSSPEVFLQLRMGIRSVYDRPEPRCDINVMKQNWQGWMAELQSDVSDGTVRNDLVLGQLAQSFNPTTNEFAVGISLYTDILGKSQEDAYIRTGDLMAKGPVKDVLDNITNRVETPASFITTEFDQKKWEASTTSRRVAMAAMENTDVLVGIGISAGSVFANTLLSQLTNKLYTGLFDFDAIEEVDPFDYGMIASSDREAAQDRFRGLLSVAPLEVSNYSILSEFSACPSRGRGLYNCVADSTFISAVARAETGSALTVEEAIEDELVDGNWPLIPSSDSARDQDPYCYTYGFCHSNLVKLRKARIIPIGWELAADSDANSVDDPVTLQEAIDGFDDCNASGERDENYPWCKLVDPDWVLKYPDTQCRALVYGQLLETEASDSRQQECVDMPSCIAEDENGNCVGGYGYCVREENAWEFRGDSCPEYAASCLSFTDSDGDEDNYILNTVDYGDCDESNVGCLWYWDTKEEGEDGSWDWPTVTEETVASLDDAEGTHEDRLYFTAEMEECDEADGGCTELIERDADLRLNELVNPGFEDDEDNSGVPDGWLLSDASFVTWSTDGSVARTGSGAMQTSGAGEVYQTGIVLQQGVFYTLSAYASLTEDLVDSGAYVSLTLADEDTGETIDFTGLDYSDECEFDGLYPDTIAIFADPQDTDFARSACTFTTPRLSDASSDLIATVRIMSADAWVDDIQLEQGEDASDYHEGYGDSALSYTYAKVAPDYLNCDGGADDAEECGDYAGVCEETEVGCSAYEPTNGDPTVYGVTSSVDECPSTCVDYDTYKQEATYYEPAGDFPVYLIPDSAEECSEESVGCDEFTRLSDETLAYFTFVRACVTEDQADANTNGDEAATFYTWEGSDLTGYQLVTWSLLESDLDSVSSDAYNGSGLTETGVGSAPCTNWTADENGITCNDDGDDADGHFDTDSEDCDEHDDIFTNPNCREFYDADGNIHYRDWSLTVTVNDACTSFRKTDLVGLGDDDDADGTDDGEENCVTSGGDFDSATSTCIYYGYEDESQTCSESENGCREYTGGRSRNSRLVLEETFEDGDLTNWEAASAETVTYSNESVATDGHSLASNGAAFWSYLFANSGTCDDGDTGEGCASTASVLGGECTVTDGDAYCGALVDELYTDKTYTLSFWAKGTGTIEVGFDIDATPSAAEITADEDISFGEVELSASGWEEYRLGPLDITDEEYPNFGTDTVLVMVPDTGVEFYIDNIVLREGEDNLTLIKDSWVTPAECDETPEGESSPQYYLGCQEYTDQDAETVYLKSFSSLCSEDVVGCEDFFATHESASPHAQVFGATCSRLDSDTDAAVDCYTVASGTTFDTTSTFLCTIGIGETSCQFNQDWYTATTDLPSHISYGAETEIVSTDTAQFLVVTDDVECDSSAAGCTEVGLPTFSADRQSIEESTSMWVLNLPEDYDEILCAHSELFCEEWETEEEGTFYFKDPVDQLCEYRTDVTVNGASYDGWFRTDTSEFCYGTCEDSGDACASDADCGSGDSCDTSEGSYLVGGDQSGIWLNGDDEYGGWVGACSDEYDGCREFVDMLDIGSENFYGDADGEAYYYLDNESLEESTLPSSQRCDDQVSQKEGCGLFYDTTETGLLYSATASFVASTHADALFGDKPYGLVDPIDCDSDDSAIETTDGDEVDLCERRCAYDNDELYDITGGTGTTYGTSCYENADCAAYESEEGDTVEGSCTDGATRLENDTNRVVKVNRDRQCSEWLTCSDSQTVWDERTNSYKTVCGDISLCEEYSSDGNASFCSAWKDDSTAAVLDIDRYAERDVSWYGDDYSGMAIPNLFPVELLTQELVSPPSGYCDLSGATYADSGEPYPFAASTMHGSECDTDDAESCNVGPDVEGETCVTEDVQEFNLVYDAGYCEEDYGVECTVGYCENTGEACSDSDACGDTGGECLIGQLVYPFASPASCVVDADCAEASNIAVCDAGQCVLNGDMYEIDSTISQDYLRTSVLTKTGTCVRNSCLLAASGDPLDVTDGEGMICRGYPEANSPFATEVVTDWKDPEMGTVSEENATTAPDAVPYDYVSGFTNVQTCAPGEDCLCTYKKVQYGDTTVTRYYGEDSTYPDGADDAGIGICSGGDYEGMYCEADAECDPTGTEEDAECVFAAREDLMLGLEGYCLERDTGINVNGNRDEDHRACVSWLPVDQLSGATDLYAKYINAGFFEDTYMCMRTAPYVTVGMSSHTNSVGGIACVETDGLGMSSFQEAYDDSLPQCSVRVECPDGYAAILGAAEYDNNTAANGSLADACSDSSGGSNDCPYVCVPEDASRLNDDGTFTSCTLSDGYTFDGADRSWVDIDEATDGTTVYWASLYDDTDDDGEYEEVNRAFDAAVEEFADCYAYGVAYDDDLQDVVAGQGCASNPDDCADADGDGFRYLDFEDVGFDAADHMTPYAACTAFAEVASTDESYAWTDRVYQESTAYALETATEVTQYVTGTGPNVFGAAAYSPAEASEYGPPLMVAQCWNETSEDLVTPDADGFLCSSSLSSPEISDADPSSDDLDARSLADFSFDYTVWPSSGGFSFTPSDTDERYQDIVDAMTSVFAKITNNVAYSWNDSGLDATDGRDYESGITADTFETWYTTVDTDDMDVRETAGNPPTVWSLDLGSCSGTECEEGEEDLLTLNSGNSGEQAGSGFFRAYLKFYAAADKNQLPIRRIIVDWGDGDTTGSNDPDNYYKNHRGLVSGSSQSKCETDAEWGMTSDSCDPNYFSYNHIYTCEEYHLSGARALDECAYDENGLITNSPCTDGDACYFVPRVHIRDNWGWCTGECAGGDDESDGCFEGTDTLAMSTASTSNNDNECNYADMPSTEYPADPWVYYNGAVVVTP